MYTMELDRERRAQTAREKDSDTFECVCMCAYLMGACRWRDSVNSLKASIQILFCFKCIELGGMNSSQSLT